MICPVAETRRALHASDNNALQAAIVAIRHSSRDDSDTDCLSFAFSTVLDRDDLDYLKKQALLAEDAEYQKKQAETSIYERQRMLGAAMGGAQCSLPSHAASCVTELRLSTGLHCAPRPRSPCAQRSSLPPPSSSATPSVRRPGRRRSQPSAPGSSIAQM